MQTPPAVSIYGNFWSTGNWNIGDYKGLVSKLSKSCTFCTLGGKIKGRRLRHWIWTSNFFNTGALFEALDLNLNKIFQEPFETLRFILDEKFQKSKWRLYQVRLTWTRDKEFLTHNGHLFNSHQQWDFTFTIIYQLQGMNRSMFQFLCDNLGWIVTPPSFIGTNGLENGSKDTMVGVSTRIRINKLKESAADLLN